jgi:hypothetical protein
MRKETKDESDQSMNACTDMYIYIYTIERNERAMPSRGEAHCNG